MRLTNFLPDKDSDNRTMTSGYSRLRSIKASKQDTKTDLEQEMRLVNFGIVESYELKQNMMPPCSISEFTDDMMSQNFCRSMNSIKVHSNNSSSADKKIKKQKKDELDLLRVSPIRKNFKKKDHTKLCSVRL